jgi:ATP-dependent helicase/nuclease subunit B
VDPFLEQLKQLCAAYPTRNKWIFVPSHPIGRTLGERLTLEGTNWLNLRFVTPLDIALRMAGPFLVEGGIEPSEEGLGPALMMRLLHDLPPQPGYFRPLAEQPSMAEALWSTLRELRMAGVRSDGLKADWFSAPAKHKELVALISAYEGFLADHKRGDMTTVYEEALKHVSWCPIQPEDCWTELPDTFWTPAQRKLIDSVGGDRIAPRALEVSDYRIPRRLSQSADRVKPDFRTNPLAFLMIPTLSATTEPVATEINLFNAGGRAAEIDEVFRSILASGSPLDQVEIACPSDAHVSLIWEKTLRHEWPVTLGAGIPAAFTRPGRALIGLCNWIETDFAAGHFRRLLQSGDLRVEDSFEFTAGQAARQLARAGAGWGRATYGLSFARLLKNYEGKAADEEASEDDRTYAKEKAELTAKVRDWIAGLVTSVPEPDKDRKVDLQSVVTSTLEFLQRATARSSALDHRASAALEDYIGELRALGPFLCGLPEALRFIRERVQSLQVASERPRPGHLYVCSLSQCGFAGRKHLFVVGLEEGRVFPAPTEDAVLLDEERKRISGDLRLSQDKIDESVYGFLSRLASSPATSLTFSYSCRDTREYRETYASWIVLQAYRLQQRNPNLSYTQMKEALGEPKSAVPTDRDKSVSAEEWWLGSVVNSGDKGIRLVEGNFPDVAQGRTAELKRQSPEFTAFDGYVPEAGPVLDPCSPKNVFSVTELEGAAQCPFRFFLKRGLGVQPVDEIERDKDVWLDPLTRGSELHDLYAALLRRTRDGSRRPNAEDMVWLIALTRQRLEELNVEMPAATPEIFERESKDFVADVELFIEAESNSSSSTPIAFELSFGRPLARSDEPLARPKPVELDLGDGLVLRIAGRMDRIDKVGKTTFEVLDYKTGGYWRDGWKGVFDGGRRLQHALYGLAAVELLKAQYNNPKVEAGIYYFSTHKGRQERREIKAPPLEKVAQVMRDLRSVIAKGEFSQSANEKDCKFCSFARGCGVYADGQLEIKLKDPKLDDFRRLSLHE